MVKTIIIWVIITFLGFLIFFVSFIYQMLNSKFRKQYFLLREICKELELSSNLDLLKNFDQVNNFDIQIFSLYYNTNNRTKDDDLYNSNYCTSSN